METIYLGTMLGSVIYVSIFSGVTISRTRKAIKEKRLMNRSTLVRTKRIYFSFVILFLIVAILAAITSQLLFAFIWLFNSFIWNLSYRKHQRLIGHLDRLEDIRRRMDELIDNDNKKDLNDMTSQEREEFENDIKTKIKDLFDN